MDSVLETLVSVPFAVAVTALLRKRWPQIDGWAVYVVVLALTILGAVLGHYRAAIPTEVWTAAGPLLAAVLALGGVTTAQHVAGRTKAPGNVAVPDLREAISKAIPDFDPSEAPTRKEPRND